jgi:hypothetical protein
MTALFENCFGNILFSHRRRDMCEYPLCMQLREELSAAFHGESPCTESPVGAWVNGFMRALEKLLPETSLSYEVVWHLANEVLLSTYSKCPCDGLIDHISHHPEAFLRSILVMAKMHDSRPDGNFGPPVFLH